jgi:hypothetical protein
LFGHRRTDKPVRPLCSGVPHRYAGALRPSTALVRQSSKLKEGQVEICDIDKKAGGMYADGSTHGCFCNFDFVDGCV